MSMLNEFQRLAATEGNEPIRCSRMHFSDWAIEVELLEEKVRVLESALGAQFLVDTESRLFEGLRYIGPCCEGTLLATLAKKQGELDQLRKAILAFLRDSSWARYGRDADAVEMRVHGKDFKVQCGLLPFDELAKALVKSDLKLENWRERCLEDEV